MGAFVHFGFCLNILRMTGSRSSVFFSGYQHDFCTYMQLDYAEQDGASARMKEISFLLPATIQEIPHGDPVLRICSLSDSTLITAREDGTVSFWSPQLQLKRSKMVFVCHIFSSCGFLDYSLLYLFQFVLHWAPKLRPKPPLSLSE